MVVRSKHSKIKCRKNSANKHTTVRSDNNANAGGEGNVKRSILHITWQLDRTRNPCDSILTSSWSAKFAN